MVLEIYKMKRLASSLFEAAAGEGGSRRYRARPAEMQSVSISESMRRPRLTRC